MAVQIHREEIMSVLWKPSKWFAGKAGVAAISLQALREERVGLDNEARRLRRDQERVEADLRFLIADYQAARRDAASPEQLRFRARQYAELKGQIRHLEAQHDLVIKQMRLLQGLEQVKDNEARFRGDGRHSVLSVDLEQLRDSVQKEIAQNELGRERLDDLLHIMEDADERASIVRDVSLTDAMHELESLAGSSDGVSEEIDTAAIESAVARIDRELDTSARIGEPMVRNGGQ